MTGRWINSADSHVYEPYELWSTPLGKKWGETVPRFLDSPVGETRRTYFNGEIYLPEDKVFALKAWTLPPDPSFPAGFSEAYRTVSQPIEGRWLNFWVRRDWDFASARWPAVE